MANQKIVLAGKGNDLLKELKGSYCTGWIIRVVQPHDLGRPGSIQGYCLQVRQKAVLFQQGHEY